MSGEIWNYVVAAAWVFSVGWSLLRLRRSALPAGPQALWALAILFIPLLGAIAFLAVGLAAGKDAHES
jgi:hypothetical protein